MSSRPIHLKGLQENKNGQGRWGRGEAALEREKSVSRFNAFDSIGRTQKGPGMCTSHSF